MLELTAYNIEEFEEYIENHRYEVSNSIVNTIIANLNTKRKNIHLMEVYLEEEDDILEITLHRNDFLDALNKNLKVYEEFEDYEGCSQIVRAIKQIEDQI